MRFCFGRPPIILGLLIALSFAAPASPSESPQKPATIHWQDLTTFKIEGQGWTDTAARFDRLPARAEEVVRPPVWALSQNSAGLSVQFTTDATTIHARWTLRSDRITLPHMAATGASGLDLYVLDGQKWRFLAVGRPTKFPLNQVVLTQGLATGDKVFRLYLPLYNGVDKLEIGIADGATLRPIEPAHVEKPIVFYGTSITQGGCASRPGMAYPAILGRRLGRPTINLGFSGNGKSEPEMGALLAELDPAAFVLDSLPNLETAQAIERLPEFIAKLRAGRPRTPIILVENLIYTNAPFVADREKKWKTSNEFLRSLYERLKQEGDQNLFLISANQLIGDDGEGTVDALHPTDAGFLRMADAMEPVVRQAIAR